MNYKISSKYFYDLLKIMEKLRKKCPWDKKQTFESLRKLTIEELYELITAIDEKNFEEIKNELGDLLLHIIFYSKIAEEENKFTIKDVLLNLKEKLIKRHPHIFSNVKVKNETEVVENWEKIKVEKENKKIFDGVPKNLPSLIRAYRIQEKAQAVGFDWEHKEQVWEKVKEELNEVLQQCINQDKEKLTEEFGDLVFAIVNAARLYNIDIDMALQKTNDKFIARFNFIEEYAKEKGVSIRELTLKEMDEVWNSAKSK
ncbi:MAG: nucleoside triphosphate pyrophosphohydrolase [Bacteroidales bacterium]|nr:nucleoside triphosphate pyrophosphohydrolase [Bacteroidales bacterium]